MWEEWPDLQPDFSKLLEARTPQDLKLELGSAGRGKPGATRTMRIKSAYETRCFRRMALKARVVAGDVNPNASRVPSPAKGLRPPPSRSPRGEDEEAAVQQP